MLPGVYYELLLSIDLFCISQRHPDEEKQTRFSLREGGFKLEARCGNEAHPEWKRAHMSHRLNFQTSPNETSLLLLLFCGHAQTHPDKQI